MRIVPGIISNDMITSLNNTYQYIDNVGNQLSSGKRLNQLSDDPSSVTVAVDMHASIDANTQYTSTSQLAQNWLESTNSALQQLTTVTSRARTLTLQASNDTNTPAERSAISQEIGQLTQEVVQIGNTSFGGNYVFAGTKVQSPPFTSTGVFGANSGAIIHQIAPGYAMQVNTDPTTIFTGGNGTTGGMGIFKTLSQLALHLTTPSAPLAPINTGTETMTLSGAYAPVPAAPNASILVKINALNPDATIKDVVMSNDGGTTWSALPIVVTPGTPPTAVLNDASNTTGITASFNLGTALPQPGDQFGFNTGLAGNTTYAVQSGSNVGNESATIAGAFTGTGTPTYTFKPTAFDTNNNVVSMQYSTDGTTWTTVPSNEYNTPPAVFPTLPTSLATGTPTTYTLGSGLTLTWNQSTVNPTLLASKGDMLTYTPTETNLTNDLHTLDAVIASISGQQAQLGAQQNAARNNIQQLQAQAVTMTKGLSQIEDADITALATHMASAQNLYKSALAVDAKSIEPSLVDFLK